MNDKKDWFKMINKQFSLKFMHPNLSTIPQRGNTSLYLEKARNIIEKFYLSKDFYMFEIPENFQEIQQFYDFHRETIISRLILLSFEIPAAEKFHNIKTDYKLILFYKKLFNARFL